MSAVTDPLDAVIALLKADTELDNLTSGRIFAAELDGKLSKVMPTAAIVVSDGGGTGSYGNAFQRYGDSRYDLRCYGGSPKTAKLVYRTAYPLLKQLEREVHNGCLLHWAKKSGGPMSLRDPDTKWPFIFSSWQILAAETPIT